MIGDEELEEYKQAGVLTDDDNRINRAIKDYRTSKIKATMKRSFFNLVMESAKSLDSENTLIEQEHTFTRK